MKKVSSTSEHLKKLVCVAMFCALAYIVSFCFPIKVQFLTFDAKDSVIAIAGMFFGPIAALSLSVAVPFLEFISFSDTGIYGFIMNFLSSAAFSITASLVYKYKRKMSGAAVALISAVIAATATMMVANLFITPFYVSMPMKAVAKLIPSLLLPFNLTKAVFNSGLVLLFYKPFTTALKAARLVPKTKDSKTSPFVTIITIVAALTLLGAAFFVYISVLGGTFSFFGK